MRSLVDPRVLLLVIPLLLGACGDSSRTRGLVPTGPTTEDAVVVESATLETVGRREPLRQEWPECHVRGTLRNDGPRRQRVTLSFTAFDPRDAVMARATSPSNVVEAGGRTAYRAILLLFDGCEKVHRFEITRLDADPA
jgi:hypothetical protein